MLLYSIHTMAVHIVEKLFAVTLFILLDVLKRLSHYWISGFKDSRFISSGNILLGCQQIAAKNFVSGIAHRPLICGLLCLRPLPLGLLRMRHVGLLSLKHLPQHIEMMLFLGGKAY